MIEYLLIDVRNEGYRIRKILLYILGMFFWRNADIFSSTNFSEIIHVLSRNIIKLYCGVSEKKRIRFFSVKKAEFVLFHRGRSPPANLNFQQKIQIGGNDMKGNHPKRRKDKYNPYNICELEGHYYISFKDGQGLRHEFEISESLYRAFDTFELEDLSYLNIWDRHLEQSEVWEPTLNRRAFHKPEEFEETILERLQMERLHKAIASLPEVQKRRLILYYFENLTYEQIAQKEGCTKMPVKRSIEAAIKKLKEKLK